MPPPNNGNKKHTAGGKNNRNNNRKWNRKRKVEEKRQKAANRNEGKDFKNNDGYHVAIPKNVRMQVYYALQGLHNFRRDENGTNFVPNVSKEEKETERQLFMSYLRTILPASFRIANDSHSLFRDKFISQMEGYAGKPLEIQIPKDKIPLLRNITDVPSKPPVVANGSDAPQTKKDSNNEEEEYITKTIPPVERIPYIPHAYQLSLDRRTLRKNPSLTEFHNWLKIASDSGFITRQETVSAIPPVALQIEPHHLVLDMCAAPGSKTCQILETVGDIAPGGKEPQGCVVANDVDEKRAYMLVRQLKRLNSPAVFVTSVDARFFPGTEVFDRVLCDVPCSGDGTVRKNPGIWRFWNQNGSLSLHRLQLTIAMRGAQLLKPGE